MRFDQFDADGSIAVEQCWTMVLLGLQGVADLGSTPADHRFPDDARTRPVGSVTHQIGADVTHRYAEVSGDWSAHHFDIGWPALRFRFRVRARTVHDGDLHPPRSRPIGVDDPGLVRRVAGRFASPTPLGCDLNVNAFGISGTSFAFEAEANGTTTISHGRLELRA